MSFWKEIGKAGVFKIIRDTGNSSKNIVLSGQKILDQTKDIVRTVDSGGWIRNYITETGKQTK